MKHHPVETELPWQDLGCTQYLNSVSFKYACTLEGVYRSNDHTYVVSSFESEGDLFCALERGGSPGAEREAELMPLILQLFRAVKDLHDITIAHRDISLENVLQSRDEETGEVTVRMIDFGMATSDRTFHNSVRGKPSYQAPEMHTTANYDAFLSDTFSVGVIIYCMLMCDYPWLSTKPSGCKCFEYIKQNGLRAFCKVRKARGSNKKVAECVSENMMQMLEGMTHFDPKERLTLGEKCWPDRRSVWDEPWTKA